MMVPLYACSVLATPPRAFVPDAFPCLASSDRRLVFIGIDNVFFGIALYDCFDRVTDEFLFASLVLAKPMDAFFTDVRLVLAKLWPHLVLDGSDCIDLGIDNLQRLPRRVSVTLLAHYALAASCAATSTPASPTTTSTTATPRTATSTSAPPNAFGSLDIGTRATTSPELSSASSIVQASAPRHRPRHSRYDCGGVSAF